MAVGRQRDLPDRLEPFAAMRARALLRETFGEVVDAADVLERLADLLRVLDAEADEATPNGTADETARSGTHRRKQRSSERVGARRFRATPPS